MFKKRISYLIHYILILPFMYGVHLIATSTNGFWGNDKDLLGYPICIASGVCFIFRGFVIWGNMLESEDITAKSDKSIMIFAALNGLSICCMMRLELLLLVDSALAAAVLLAAVIYVYNLMLAEKRPDLKSRCLVIGIIMFLLSINAYMLLINYTDYIFK